MKKLFIATLVILSSTNYAYQAEMPKACEEKVAKEIGPEGSYSTSLEDIMSSLKTDWQSKPESDVAHFNDCGPSDYFYVTVKKENCEVVELSWGDSDGDCY